MNLSQKYIAVFFILILFFTTSLFSQNENIVGKIINGQTLEALSFANVAYLDSDIGAVTNDKGIFELPFKKQFDKIIISYVGYRTLILPIENISLIKENLFTLLPIEIFLQEVTVYSNTNSSSNLNKVNSLTLQSERIREISAAMPDILRSIQALPGISVNNEFKADFNVRGGNQDENLVLVNGAQVYEPYHIKEASNASVGIFNVDLIQKVDLITGGFSARYGDKMSSVLNINYREGNREKYTGAASLSLAYMDGYIEGPISKNSSFIIGVRKSYMEYLLSLIDFEDIKTAKPSFYDIQGVLSYHFSPTNKILFEFIHAGDDFGYQPSSTNFGSPFNRTHNGIPSLYKASKIENENNDAGYFSNLFDIKSVNILSSKTLLNFELSYYQQTDNEHRLFKRISSVDISNNVNDEIFYDSLYTTRLTYDSLNIETLEFKTNFVYQINPNYEINVGLSLKNIIYNQDANDIWTYIRSDNLTNSTLVKKDTLLKRGSFGNEDPVNTNALKYNIYLENILQLSENLTLNIGGRIDYFELNKDLNLSPRFNIAYNAGNNFIIRGAWGNYYQSPIYRQLISSVASDTNTKAQKATHYILGIENTFYFSERLDNFLKFKIEGFYKEYDNLISSWFGTFERLTYSRKNDAKGNAKGIDFYTILSLPGFYSWLSYGLLFANENQLNDDLGEYPRYTEQRHTLSIVTNIDLGSNWNFSLKGFYGSGFPYTPNEAVKNSDNIWSWKSGETHSANLPTYKRLDLRISKMFSFESSKLNVFIDISNITNYKNIQRYEYKPSPYVKPIAEEILLWPIIPSFGIRWLF